MREGKKYKVTCIYELHGEVKKKEAYYVVDKITRGYLNMREFTTGYRFMIESERLPVVTVSPGDLRPWEFDFMTGECLVKGIGATISIDMDVKVQYVIFHPTTKTFKSMSRYRRENKEKKPYKVKS